MIFISSFLNCSNLHLAFIDSKTSPLFSRMKIFHYFYFLRYFGGVFIDCIKSFQWFSHQVVFIWILDMGSYLYTVSAVKTYDFAVIYNPIMCAIVPLLFISTESSQNKFLCGEITFFRFKTHCSYSLEVPCHLCIIFAHGWLFSFFLLTRRCTAYDDDLSSPASLSDSDIKDKSPVQEF